jgi:hypothetical protein
VNGAQWFGWWAVASVVLGAIISGILFAFHVRSVTIWKILAILIIFIIPIIMFIIYQATKNGNNPHGQP